MCATTFSNLHSLAQLIINITCYSSHHLLNTYCVPGRELRFWCALSYLLLVTTHKVGTGFVPFLIWISTLTFPPVKWQSWDPDSYLIFTTTRCSLTRQELCKYLHVRKHCSSLCYHKGECGCSLVINHETIFNISIKVKIKYRTMYIVYHYFMHKKKKEEHWCSCLYMHKNSPELTWETGHSSSTKEWDKGDTLLFFLLSIWVFSCENVWH